MRASKWTALEERKIQVTSLMGRARTRPRIVVIMLSLLLSSACQPILITPTMDMKVPLGSSPSAATDTATPNPCTGWTCEVQGVVYAQSPSPGNELNGIRLTLTHSSNCSTTQGQLESVTNNDGSFSFPEVFFHDTDRVKIQVDQEGYASWEWDSAGQYCFYCTCFYEPILAVLQPEVLD